MTRSQPDPPGGTSSADLLGLVAQHCEALRADRSLLARLAEENSALRASELRELVIGPVCNGVVRIIDRVEEDLAEYDAALRNTKNPEFRKLLKSARANRALDRDELLELLAVRGVRPFRTAAGSRLRSDRQSVHGAKTAPTTNDVGRVFQSIRPGYADERSGWIVRPEWVGVYTKPSVNPPSGEHT